MGKVLLGVAVGIVLAAAAFILLGPVDRNDGGLPVGVLPTSPESEPTVAESGAGSLTGDQMSAGSATSGSGTAAAGGEDYVPSNRELEVRAPAINEAARVDAALRAAQLAALSPPSSPIVLPSEFDYLTENPNVFHERLQRETADPTWFAQTEAELRSYFAAHPEITAKYGFPSIHCRSTACAVAFVSYGLDYPANAGAGSSGPSGSAAMAFRQENQRFFDEPSGARFNGQLGVVADAHVEDEVTTIYWFLPRGDQQTNAAASGMASL